MAKITVLGKFLDAPLHIEARQKRCKVTGQQVRDVFIVGGPRPIPLSRGNILLVTNEMLVSKVKKFYSDKITQAGGVLWYYTSNQEPCAFCGKPCNGIRCDACGAGV